MTRGNPTPGLPRNGACRSRRKGTADRSEGFGERLLGILLDHAAEMAPSLLAPLTVNAVGRLGGRGVSILLQDYGQRELVPVPDDHDRRILGRLAALVTDILAAKHGYTDLFSQAQRCEPMSVAAEIQSLLPPLAMSVPQVPVAGILDRRLPARPTLRHRTGRNLRVHGPRHFPAVRAGPLRDRADDAPGHGDGPSPVGQRRPSRPTAHPWRRGGRAAAHPDHSAGRLRWRKAPNQREGSPGGRSGAVFHRRRDRRTRNRRRTVRRGKTHPPDQPRRARRFRSTCHGACPP